MEDKLFIRDKIFGLYTFSAKTIITLSSSALAFSVGLQSILKQKDSYDYSCLLLLGWASLIGSIILIIWMIKIGVELYYEYFNNIQNGLEEFSPKTLKLERELEIYFYGGLVAFLVGLISILSFIFINL